MLIKEYYRLTKPGIIYGNLIVTTAGFLLASKLNINFLTLLALLFGTSFVIASGCVFNNIADREIDTKMTRTKNRALVKKTISTQSASIFAFTLGMAGFVLLTLYTNFLTVSVGLVGFLFYVVLYGIWKRRSIYGTLIGSISGATPPVAGYVAVTNQFDLGALLLFLILVFWQMPHFYAIAIYRFDDYKSAMIPVLPIEKGVLATKIQILLFMIAFAASLPFLTIFGYTGYTFLVVMFLITVVWLRLALQGFSTKNDKHWARRIFLFSQVVIVSLSVALSVGGLLP